VQVKTLGGGIMDTHLSYSRLSLLLQAQMEKVMDEENKAFNEAISSLGQHNVKARL
jgi:hypothetical protein